MKDKIAVGIDEMKQEIKQQSVSTNFDFKPAAVTSYLPFNNRMLKEVAQLGEGGFAYVSKVRDDSTGEEFALKKIALQNKEIQRMTNEEVKTWK